DRTVLSLHFDRYARLGSCELLSYLSSGEIAVIEPYIKALWIPWVIASITQYYLPWPGRIAMIIP
ncbi:hypothetical protein, partial [Salmonella enterica]|uniref:hypothetical protein n=1 Tax=Salmonella enterica TaxID=28901 RepID=UPI003EDBC05C